MQNKDESNQDNEIKEVKEQSLNKKPKKSIKKVCWDEDKLAEQELEKKLNPKMKIDEPKTPYTELKDDETDNYLLALKEVNSITDPSIIEKAISQLNRNKFEEQEEEEMRKAKNKQMQKKAYQNEFLLAKQLSEKLCEEDNSEVVKETMDNTLYNKYVGKLTKDKTNDDTENKEN